MKQNNLLKKVGSVVTTAAMLASLGTTGFAAAVIQNGDLGITDVTVSQVGTSPVYDVTVQYNTEGVTNNIGVTMLTYAKTNGDDVTGYTAYNGEDMKIVSVDQNGTGASSFSFKITTDSANGGIYMQPGQVGIVAISGDGVTGLTAAKIEMPVAPVTATGITATIGEIKAEVNANLKEEKVLETVATKAKEVIGNTTEASVVSGLSNVGKVTIDSSWVSAKKDGATYKAVVTVPAGTAVTKTGKAEVNVPNALTLETSASVEVKAVNATTVTKFDDKEVTDGAVTVAISNTDFTDEEALKSEIKTKSVTVALGGDNTTTNDINGTVSLANASIEAPAIATQSLDVKTYTYEVTVPAGNTSNDNLKIGTDGLKFTLSYSVSEKVAQTVEFKDYVAPATFDLAIKSDDTANQTADKIGAAVMDKIKATEGLKLNVTYKEGEETDVTEYDATDAKISYAYELTDDFKVKVKVTGITDSNISFSNGVEVGEYTYALTQVYTATDVTVSNNVVDYTKKTEDENVTADIIKAELAKLDVKVGDTKLTSGYEWTVTIAEDSKSYKATLKLNKVESGDLAAKWPTADSGVITKADVVSGTIYDKPQIDFTLASTITLDEQTVALTKSGSTITTGVLPYNVALADVKTAIEGAISGVKLGTADKTATFEWSGDAASNIKTEDQTLTLEIMVENESVEYTVALTALDKAATQKALTYSVEVGSENPLGTTVKYSVEADAADDKLISAEVEWTNLSDVKMDKPGSYTVNGTVKTNAFNSAKTEVVEAGTAATATVTVTAIAGDASDLDLALNILQGYDKAAIDAVTATKAVFEAYKVDGKTITDDVEVEWTAATDEMVGKTESQTFTVTGTVKGGASKNGVYTFADDNKTVTITFTVVNQTVAPQAFKAENAGAYNKGNVTVYATADTAKDRTVEVKWFKYVNDTVDGTPIATSTATLAKDATEVTVATAADLTTYGLSANDQYAVKVTIDGVPLAFTSGAGTADFVYDTVAQSRVNGGGSGTVVGGGGIVGGGTTSKGDDVDNKGDENTGDVDNKGDDTQTPSTSNGGFSDVDETHWASEDIKYVTEEGLMNGTSEEEFAPEETLTRSMLVTVLYRAAGSPEVNKSIPFSDVSADSYYAAAVSWAQQNGIVNGVTESEFDPEANITREQIATIIYRYANYMGYDVSVGEDTNILSFEDAGDISEFAVEAMQYAVGAGLINGKSETTLNPQDNATRAEIAAILHRFLSANK